MKRVALFLLIYFVLATLIGLMFAKDLPRYRRLAREGADTVGRVSELHPELHNTFTYRFSVDGKEYVGGAPAWPELKIGDTVRVRYLPVDPEVSTPYDAQSTFDHVLRWAFLAAAVGPIFFIVVLQIHNKVWQRH
jgi:hypothetical protein